MNAFLLASLLAMTSSLVWPSLLSLPLLYVSCVALAALLWKRKLWAAGFIFGLCWIGVHGIYYQSWGLAIQQKTANSSILGKVLAVDNNQYWQKITVEIDLVNAKHSIAWWKPKLILYSALKKPATSLQVGQVIHGTAKLKPAYANVNPAGFNYARWLLSKNIVGRGSLLDFQVIDASSEWREPALQLMAEKLKAYQHGGEILALMVGDKRLLSQSRISLYQRSGLGHLFVLSGLHLGIAAFWSWLLFRGFCRGVKLRSESLPLLLSLLSCLLYCWLANWPLSMMRAWLMYACLLLFFLLGERRRPVSALLVSAFIIMLLWPFSLYNNGFWLSYIAVSVVLLCLWWGSRSKWQSLLVIQFALGLVMLPVQVMMFGVVPSFALVLNLVAVPLFSSLLVPLTLLLGMLSFSPWFEALAGIVDSLFSLLYGAIVYFESKQTLSFSSPALLSGLLLLMPSFILALLVLPKAVSRVFLLASLLLPSMLGLSHSTQSWQVYVLDVGQGLAVVVMHQGEALIYDTGPRYRSGFNHAQATLLPLLANLSVKRVRDIVISHGDNDHAGARLVLEQAFPEAEHHYGRDPRLPSSGCSGAEQWGRLSLSYYMAELGDGNNGSCVLLIDDGQYRLLLSGDIEAKAEQQLLEQGLGKVSFLLSPHHGSASSSSKAFVEALQAEVVIHSSGAFNRFNFPADEVLARYADSQQFITGRDGAIRLNIDERAYQVHLERYRAASPWYQQIISW
ncbi:DNA internalization-related competence protein ComEC/Rec2 [Agarivorans gilvus]|uniref:DNA internalization-related competence protein ComEC/Rec2 n=1 Tax=Agarivorans gilvus TaxID=680279 RepID=UPI0006EBF243|nr:DNA internalization-related competence protein ComEC/Rec2 [Agarivorans gilvus]